jgi:hypothetical protein
MRTVFLIVAYLYRELLGPAEGILRSVNHIFFDPDGALQSFPLGVLVTSMPSVQSGFALARNEELRPRAVTQRGIRTTPSDVPEPRRGSDQAFDYGSVDWLVKRYSY